MSAIAIILIILGAASAIFGHQYMASHSGESSYDGAVFSVFGIIGILLGCLLLFISAVWNLFS